MAEKKKLFREPNDNSIRWLGIDGLLILLIISEAVVGIVALKYKIDVLSGYVFPLALLCIVLAVTVNYAMTLGGFIKMQNEQIRKNKKKELDAKQY